MFAIRVVGFGCRRSWKLSILWVRSFDRSDFDWAVGSSAELAWAGCYAPSMWQSVYKTATPKPMLAVYPGLEVIGFKAPQHKVSIRIYRTSPYPHWASASRRLCIGYSYSKLVPDMIFPD